MSSNARLTWESASNGGQHGYILGTAHGYNAKITLFGISFDPIVGPGGPWVLAHRLPFQQLDKRFSTAKAAQQHAERYLLLATELMGFVPATPRTEVRYRKMLKGTTIRLGSQEPKHIVAETRDFVIIHITSAKGDSLGEQSIARKIFDADFERVPA